MLGDVLLVAPGPILLHALSGNRRQAVHKKDEVALFVLVGQFLFGHCMELLGHSAAEIGIRLLGGIQPDALMSLLQSVDQIGGAFFIDRSEMILHQGGADDCQPLTDQLVITDDQTQAEFAQQAGGEELVDGGQSFHPVMLFKMGYQLLTLFLVAEIRQDAVALGGQRPLEPFRQQELIGRDRQQEGFVPGTGSLFTKGPQYMEFIFQGQEAAVIHEGVAQSIAQGVVPNRSDLEQRPEFVAAVQGMGHGDDGDDAVVEFRPVGDGHGAVADGVEEPDGLEILPELTAQMVVGQVVQLPELGHDGHSGGGVQPLQIFKNHGMVVVFADLLQNVGQFEFVGIQRGGFLAQIHLRFRHTGLQLHLGDPHGGEPAHQAVIQEAAQRNGRKTIQSQMHIGAQILGHPEDRCQRPKFFMEHQHKHRQKQQGQVSRNGIQLRKLLGNSPD